ncbi:unnamed protein product [Microthlaspi erraticum]|uniref:Helitron helicase-like domain-containing protein n=1 Tax=Microthlaspi erraticum TaxID=1685480 RepID=A0A6D2HIT7_9BRAS|nr:unnamed protein product [Microthlaspi erraticum]
MALQYPMLFPYGDSGFHLRIPYAGENEKTIQREYLTVREYYAYQLQTRLSEGKTMTRGGRLYHQFIVDAYTIIEEERLKFNRLNQKKLRADLYNNVCDAVGRGDSDSKSLGTFVGGPRYMVKNYHDAMVLCRTYGNPHLFVTITANPGWEDVKEHLQKYGNDTADDRPEITTRAFHSSQGRNSFWTTVCRLNFSYLLILLSYP